MSIITLSSFISLFDNKTLSLEEGDEIILLKKYINWIDIDNWGMIQMIFITSNSYCFYNLCMNYIFYSIKTKNISDTAAEIILRKLLEYPEKFCDFKKSDLQILKIWIDNVFFEKDNNNGAYEKWQYDENIDILILLS